MALEIEGTLAQKLPVQSGSSARGPWTKQEFILEFPDGNFTAKACFLAWGQEKVQDLGKYQVGDKVKVSFNLKSREYNGRWYNDLQPSRTCPRIPKARRTSRSKTGIPWKHGSRPISGRLPFLCPGLTFLRKKRW